MRCLLSARVGLVLGVVALAALGGCAAREPFSLHVVEFGRPSQHSGRSINGVVSYQRTAVEEHGRAVEATSLSVIRSSFSLEQQNYGHWVWPDERIGFEFASPDQGVFRPAYTVRAPQGGVLQDDIEAVVFEKATFLDSGGAPVEPRPPSPRPELYKDVRVMPLLVVGRSGVRIVPETQPDAEVAVVAADASRTLGPLRVSSVGSVLTVRGVGEDTDLWLGGLCHADGVQRHGDCLTVRAHILAGSKLELGQTVPRRLGVPSDGGAAIDVAKWKPGDHIAVTGKSAKGWFSYLIYASPPPFLAPHQIDPTAVAYVVTLLEDSSLPYRNDWIGAGDERVVRRALEAHCDERLDAWWRIARE